VAFSGSFDDQQFYLIWPAAVFFCAIRYFSSLSILVGAVSLGLRVTLSTGNFMAQNFSDG
jgi:peptidoglycan/LPS O-acetylase OafA/YrhL